MRQALAVLMGTAVLVAGGWVALPAGAQWGPIKSPRQQESAKPESSGVGNLPATGKVLKAPTTHGKPTFSLIDVEITKKPQLAQRGANFDLMSGNVKPITGKIVPHKGAVFVIIDYSMTLPNDNMKLEFARDLYLLDAEGDKINGAPYTSDSFFLGGTGQNFSKKGAQTGKMLFEVKQKNVNGSNIVFFGDKHPVNQ